MAKIIKLSKFDKQENKAKESEFHPSNQKFWNDKIDSMTIAHFGTLTPKTN